MPPMRILMTGASGMLGRATIALLGSDRPETVGHKDLLARREEGVRELFRRTRPDVVLHFAAMTAVDACETSPEEARLANTELTRLVAVGCATVGSRLVYPSTDYIFDGLLDRPYKEGDLPLPLSVYGRTKLEGERHALGLGDRGLVVRSSWIYGKGGGGKASFVDRILQRARTLPELRVVDDQRGRPTFARHLAGAILWLVERGQSGVWNATNTGTCTWREFAEEILRQAGLATKVVPITSAELGLPAPRPVNSVLDLDKLWAEGYTLPHWKDALAEYLAERT